MRTNNKQSLRASKHLRFITSRSAARTVANRDSPLRIAGVYGDSPSHAFALEAASEREAAACAAANADMVWCATNACESLPEGVRAWADLWSAHRSECEGALVTLLRCPSDYAIEQSPSWAYLCWLARQTGMVLFAQRFEGDGCRRADPPSLPSLVSGWLPLPNEPERGYRHWGINE